MAEEEACKFYNFIKSEDFERAVLDIYFYWYDTGFKIARLQAEVTMKKGESSISWDP